MIATDIEPTHPLFKALLAAKAVAWEDAHAMLPQDVIMSLLRRNILSMHPDSMYTFINHHVEAYMRREMRHLMAVMRGEIGLALRGGSGAGDELPGFALL